MHSDEEPFDHEGVHDEQDDAEHHDAHSGPVRVIENVEDLGHKDHDVQADINLVEGSDESLASFQVLLGVNEVSFQLHPLLSVSKLGVVEFYLYAFEEELVPKVIHA